MSLDQPNDYTYEQISVGDTFKIGEHRLDAEEIMEFGRQWDPMPFHIDEELAKQTPFNGLIASGTHMLAIRIKLLQSQGINPAVIASLGYNDVKFLLPARPGDVLALLIECLSKRESNSRPNQGIVQFRLSLENQKGETVMSMLDSVLVLTAAGLAEWEAR